MQSTLLDREEEWQEVRRLLRSTADGFGQSLIFQGAAGTGKTAILHEAAARARSAGFRVMLARGSYLEHDVRLGLVRRLFDSVLPVLPGHDQQAFSRILQRLLREAGGRPEPGRTRRVLHLGLRRLLWADKNSPILVVVDNLHWADRESLEWLATLPQHIASMPIALLASVCAGIPGTDPTLVDETLIGSCRQVTLRDMTTNSVGALLADQFGSLPDPAFVAGVMRVTGGNPHLVTALTRKLVHEGGKPDPGRTAALDTVVLDLLGQSVRVRLRRVSPHAHAVLRAVTALDEEATLHRLCAIVGLDLDETADIVARLRRLGLLTADRGRLRVAQLLVRNAVLDEDTHGGLREIHAQAARLLRDEPGTEEAVCRHLILSTPIGEEWAAAALRSAARSALATGDPQRAVLLLQRSLSEPLSPDDRHEVLFDLAAAAGNNDLPEAAAYLTEALSERDSAYWPTRTLAGLIDVIALGGWEKDLARLFAAERGRLTTKAGLLGDRLAILSDRDSAEANEVQHLQEQEPEGALTLAVTARRVADLGADRPRALALADRVLKISPATPEELMARLQVCKVLMVAERTEEAVAQCEYGLDVARRWGHHFMIGFALTCQAACLRTAGDLSAADTAAREAMKVLTACRASPDSTAVLGLRATQVEILLDMGQVQKAAVLVDQSEPIPMKPRSRMDALLLGARGRLRRSLGQPLSALHDVIASGDYLTRHHVVNPLVSPWRFEAALAAQELDGNPQAQTHAQAELDGAHLWDTPGAVGRALRLVARVGYEPEARTRLEHSVDVLYDSDQRLSLAESLTDLGTLLARQREKTRAREVLRDACALAEETACAPLISRSRSELAAAGGRPKRPTSNGRSGLTASEWRVAQLAAGDRTNKAIAAMLFVEQRTVETHLTNAYRKLGIGGRDQLPAALRAAGLLATDH
ncbi:AAA family ATPase [Streptomyces sp. R39]|uniref:AAA family ATPase n=1 Tax=Streptomyces sp. R39 TaxID=3238631 RepID=A0AB39QG49_9ACTN